MKQKQQWQTTHTHTNPNADPFSSESFTREAREQTKVKGTW